MARPHRRSGEPELSEGVRLLDRYSILDRIGSGGMATIYRATDERLQRTVCVKLLRTTVVEGSGSTSGNRAVYQATYAHFLKEALALSRLQHPNTLRIYDFGYLEDDAPSSRSGEGAGAAAVKTPFHVSEYLDGGNLETLVRSRGPLPASEALEILDAVSGALAEAHEHGIIHRDIKPSNILFARVRGALVTKLADFGIAHSGLKKALASGAFTESVSTVALFSPRWAAPEQLCGSPEGPRTDVYALGLLVIYMLTGRVLFGDDDVRVTFNDRVRGDALVDARLSQLGLPGELGHTLAMALRARPDARIASAPELAQRVRSALSASYFAGAAPAKAPPPARAAQAARHAPSPATIEVERSDSGGDGLAPSERVVAHGASRVRYVRVHERLDLSLPDARGERIRFRLTMLPGPTTKVNVKGLSCFVARESGRPTPAVTISGDTPIELISSARQRLAEFYIFFGRPSPDGHLFVVDGKQLLVPYAEAQQAIVLMLTGGDDILVMCRS